MKNRIEQARREQNMTRIDMAMRAGISYTWANLVERGHSCGDATKEKIAAALGEPVAKLWPERDRKAA